ncbi:dynein axonemal heavy chain 6-like isoform X3 [Argopecten irradians]|uniref:dynein axonemal heavy chain 6-like isoform X3 n=1 Tax=Argopecten irradians TaxID=31199 RepID=UPI00371CCF29
MSEARGESRASYASQSQYSESTIINQDITDQALLQAHKSSNQAAKVVSFAPGSGLERAKTVEELGKQQSKGMHAGKHLDLMERLIDRPHNADVFRMVKASPRENKQGQQSTSPSKSPSIPNGTQGPTRQSPLIPRPPSAKTNGAPMTSFRTTIFKRDYQKRQIDLNQRNQQPPLDPPKLTVSMLHKKKPKVVSVPITPADDMVSEGAEDLEILAELVELMGDSGATETETISKDLEAEEDVMMSKPTAPPEIPPEEKTVTFSKDGSESSPTKSLTSRVSTGKSFDDGVTEDEDIDVCLVKYPGDIPIIDTVAPPPVKAPPPIKEKAPMTDRSASTMQKDVHAGLKKRTKYDDTVRQLDGITFVPENDDMVHNLIRLRERLGWESEIPRHAPGCKASMMTLRNIPEEEAENIVGSKYKEDDGDFVYCLPKWRKNRRARYDPYDLQVVSANTARSHKVYYTVTASFITTCTMKEDGSTESVNDPALWWLWERRLFYMIHLLPVFVKFRLWKTFKMWKRNVRLQKSAKSKVVLYKSLFVANEVLQGCLIHVRSLCEAACGSNKGLGDGESAVSLISMDRGATLTLQEFKEIQEKQGKVALEKLNALRRKIIDIVWESCATVAEMEGITHGIRSEGVKKVIVKEPKEEEVKVVTAKSKLRSKYAADIPLPETKAKKNDDKKVVKPLYAEIAEWRKILNRLSGFLRSIDYLILEMLRRLVVTAVRHLVDHLVSSYNVTDEDEEKASSYVPSSKSSSPEPEEDEVPQKPVKTGSYHGSEYDDDESLSTMSRLDFSRRQKNLKTPMSAVSTSSNVPAYARKQQKSEQGYLIPHFDFDEPELFEGPPDADEILREIQHRDQVEEVTACVFSLQLMLNVPGVTAPLSSSHPSTRGDRSTIRSNTSSRVRFDDKVDSTQKKSVKFTTNQENESDGNETSDSGEEEESSDEDYDEDNQSRNRFAYAYQEEEKKEKTDLSRSFVSLWPNENEFKYGIRDVISGFENTVGAVVSMLREPKLAVFYSPPKHDLRLNFDDEEEQERKEMMRPWPDLEFVFGDDPEYQGLLSELDSYMTMEMELVKQYSTNFDHFCVMVDKARILNVKESMARREWSTEEFQHVLSTYTDMIHQMKKMTTVRRVSMVQVQSKRFRESCLPYCEEIVSDSHQQLPIIANKRNEDLLTIIKGASKKLEHYPTSVEDFVEHLSFLGKMSTELPALDKEFFIVNKMFTIAKEFSVKIDPEDYALYQFLGPSFRHLKSTVLYSEAKKDENIRKFSRDLDNLIFSIRTKIMDLKNRIQDPDLLHMDTMSVTALETIRDLQDGVQELSVKARSYAAYQERFGSSLTTGRKGIYVEIEEYLMIDKRDNKSAQEIQSELNELEHDIMLRRILWQSQEEWTKLVEEWTATVFDSLNVQTLQKNVNRFTQTVYMLDKGLPHNEVVPRLKEKVLDFKQGMPVITSLRNPSLRRRHWENIERLIQKSIAKDKAFTLGNLLEMNIFKHKEKIQEISTRASNEATLENMLQKIIDLWQSMDFRLVAHAGRDTFIIGGADDILAQLEESQVTIGTISGSRYVAPIKNQVEEWERKLQAFARTLEEWMRFQRNWLYLEQIFSTPDIQRQLGPEHKMFTGVDKAWKDIMRRVEDRPNALKSALASGTLETLQTGNGTLEKIQKSLEDYLETKRLLFPRFYFLSNDELLDIMAQSKDPNAVQPHLGKCFGNIKSLNIKSMPRQAAIVKSMTSAEGENVNMPRNLRVRGVVEQWLLGVEAGMFETVKRHLKEGLAGWTGTELQDWVLRHPGQVVITVAQIQFNKDVVRCFDQTSPIDALIQVKDNMVDSLNCLAGLVSSDIKFHQRSSIEALLTINVHNRDIVIMMIDDKITRKDDFDWNRQLRYEWDEQRNNCLVMQSNASFQYGYEYLGCSSRLVITPLTDRCYLTLTGALHLHLGGSPAGPAGTGKTETVKDLAKAVGKQCVVFNCSEGLDYKTLGKFFSGIAQSGSWCCFDEFNRIDVEVLSVVAQQILSIKSAKDSQLMRFMFDGKEIKLNMTCGYFITMNPTYLGRVELPDNLKSLFRSVAMMVPDYAMIAEIMLFSEGFMSAALLSRKIVNLYQLASRQLSQQDHYDFGMRAIKSVLVMAGHRKHQAHHVGENEIRQLNEKDEAHILIHSLRDANLPKFLAEDVPLFERILDDLFPSIIPPEPDHGIIERAINMAIRDQSLLHWPSQVEKIKQLYNQILVRHGVMLVGPTGGGKTTVRNLLQKALILLPTISLQDNQQDPASRKQSVFQHNRAKKGHVEVFTINPKCVKLGELYGETDPNTFEWTDGLIATATRKFARENMQIPGDESRPVTAASGNTQGVGAGIIGIRKAPVAASVQSAPSEPDTEMSEKKEDDPLRQDWRWLVLDGPVDTLWVENLNTVLDDSKVLCLASGERITLSGGMRLIFEVDNLSQASPATISRCAMVYMDPVDLGWKPFVKTWLSRLPREMPESGKRYLQDMFDHTIEKGLRFARKYIRFQSIPAPEMCLVSCLCHILSAFLDFMAKNGGFGAPDKRNVPSSRKSKNKDDGGHTEVSERSESQASSHSSSRTGSRSTSRTGRSKKRKSRAYQSKIKEDLDTISETQSTKSSSSQPLKETYLQKNPLQLLNILGKMFAFAYTWSIGGNFKRQEDVDDDDSISRRSSDKDKGERGINICNEFDGFMHDLFDIEPPLGVRLPTGNRSVYSYFIDMESGNFVLWDVLVPNTRSLIEKSAVITIGETMGIVSEHKKKREETEITPTVDIVRFSFLCSLLVTNKHPVLLTGDSGVGKSALINYMLTRLKKEGGAEIKNGTVLGNVFCYSDKHSSLLENITNITRFGQEDEPNKNLDFLLGSTKIKQVTGIISSMIQFSAQTTAARFQAHIIHKLIKKGKDTLGAPKGRKVIVFVDDLNMPAPEDYGAQPPLELLRQFLELGGFFDTSKLVWKDILDVNLIAACGPTGGGRNPISPRLLKHFSMLSLPQPSTRSLQHIYQVQLGKFFMEGDFATEFKDQLMPLVSASIAVYYRMCSSMLPTPTKSHYNFNLRDLSKVIQGLLQAHETVIISKDNSALLFAHEATRVFHDRLILHEDRDTFFQFLSDILHDYFKVKWTKDMLMNEQVLFGDFFEMEATHHVYRPMSDRNKLAQVLEEYYMRMNYGNTKPSFDTDVMASQMVFFKDAVEHITRAARVFRQPGGHMMLVGLDGTGKATVVQLAAHIASCELFKLTLQRGYNFNEFRDDLKKLFLSSGVKGKKNVFLLTDADIVKESFLEDINCILNSGEVPDLFDNEELDGITMDLKHAAAEADIPDTRASVYQFFIHRVRQNLHVVLTMSPAGGKFRQRCRMNPALINCCTIDWYDEWEEEAMLSVAQVFFLNAEFIASENYDLDLLKRKVGKVCVEIHKSIGVMSTKYWDEMRRHYYSTPSSYMEFIRLYSKMLRENKTEFVNNKNRLEVGLQKLSEANTSVGTMQEILVSLGPQIEEKQRDTEVLLQQLEKDKVAAEQVRAIVREEEEIMQKETKIVQDYADECQRDLASALPALQNAVEALETLDKADIAEIRVYTSPPTLVMTVISAVCVLFQKKTDWGTAKQLLGDPSFLKKLTQFDKSSVPEKTFHKLKKYSKHPDFNPEAVGNVSGACRSICAWVLALEHYNDVYKMVKPKQKRVSEAKEALQMAQESLSNKQASLQKLQDHLNRLEQQYKDSVDQRESLKQRKVTTALRLQRASILIDALIDEKDRWQDLVKELKARLHGLVGDTLVAAAAVAYIGPFTAKYRKDLIQMWTGFCQENEIPITKDFDLIKSTVEPYQVIKWQNEGLPRDNHSTENALIIKRAQKWPLFIDPQGQAFNYVREMEGTQLQIVAASDHNFMKTLEIAISVGKPMLLKDVSEVLDPALRPVLLHETFQRGGHLVIKLGDTEIEYNESFRLYMTSSMANPHYLPSVYIQVNIINFTVTFEGLQEQLLSAVVKHEKPKLENQRSELLDSISNDLQLLRDVEDKTLGLLQKPEGNLLDDQDLVTTLQKSKGMSIEIYKRIKQSEENEMKLNQARKRYLPVATRGATIYFVLANLAGIDVMYQFSLDWFQDMFINCINGSGSTQIPSDMNRRKSSLHLSGSMRPSSRLGSSPRGSVDMNTARESEQTLNPAELKKHMLDMINRLTSNIYRVVSVALFSNHQLIFSFLLCSGIMRSNAKYADITTIGKIEEFEWQTFLHGNIMTNMIEDKKLEGHDGLTAMERLDAMSNPDKVKTPPKWIGETTWKQVEHLDISMAVFKNLSRSIMTNKVQWELFHSNSNPYKLMQKPFNMADVKDPPSDGQTGVVMDWENLSGFQKLLLIKILRPETLISSVSAFIRDQMDNSYLSTGTFDLKEIYEESSAKTPLIFILSPGCDPAAQLLRFAKELRGSILHLDMISLGRGQGPKAEELINKAQILKGRWVFLQNCHLAASWMPNLQAIVERFNQPNDDVDQQFRLWLSSKPDPCFPISILQTGMKMTVEPPQGLKANMLRAFGSGGTGVVTEKMYENPELGPAWKKLLFGLCLFNSVIHERKKYGRLGWNIAYEFNDSDLDVSMLQLQNLLQDHEPDDIPWQALSYLTGEVIYGGRVTDWWDRRCLDALLGRFFCKDALDESYSYSPDRIYHPVKDSYTFPDVLNYLENLPNYDSPELFGMTENAEKACRELQAVEMVQTIITIQPRVSLELMGAEKSNDEIVLEIARDIKSALPRLVEDFEESSGPIHTMPTPRPTLKSILYKEAPDMKDKEKKRIVQEAIDTVVGNSALMTVLRQEVDRFNNLLNIVHTSLRSLILAVKGEIIMSEVLEEAYNALLNQKVPKRWIEAAYESCKALGSWIYDLKMRVQFFSSWGELISNNVEKLIKNAILVSKNAAPADTQDQPPMRSVPRAYWLSGFFFPQGFLTGVQQNHARKLGISVDSLVFNFKVHQTVEDTEEKLGDISHKVSIKDAAFKGPSPPDDGVLIFGLYLDGARWDPKDKCLQDSRAGDRFARLPEIHFVPTQTSQGTPSTERSDSPVVDNGSMYECPLYRTSSRAGTLSSTGHSTNFVTAVTLPSNNPPHFWVMRGVAMLCQLDD